MVKLPQNIRAIEWIVHQLIILVGHELRAVLEPLDQTRIKVDTDLQIQVQAAVTLDKVVQSLEEGAGLTELVNYHPTAAHQLHVVHAGLDLLDATLQAGVVVCGVQDLAQVLDHDAVVHAKVLVIGALLHLLLVQIPVTLFKEIIIL